MRLKGRKIYGIHANEKSSCSLYVNFGESRYAYVSYEDFVKNVSTWKFDISSTNTPNWQPLLHNVKNLPRSFYFDSNSLELLSLMAKRNNFKEIKNKVIHFNDGQYLIELKEFVKLQNGRITYKNIKSFKKHTIKLQKNGTCGYSIWKGNRNLEDRIWSIEECESAIIEMSKK